MAFNEKMCDKITVKDKKLTYHQLIENEIRAYQKYKYFVHVQRSVFEGKITESKLNRLKAELDGIIDYDNDSICIYSTLNVGNILKEQIGVVEDNSSVI